MWSPPAPWPGTSSRPSPDLLPGPRTRRGTLGILGDALTLTPGEPLRGLGAWGRAVEGATLTLRGEALRRGVVGPTAVRVREASTGRALTVPLRARDGALETMLRCPPGEGPWVFDLLGVTALAGSGVLALTLKTHDTAACWDVLLRLHAPAPVEGIFLAFEGAGEVLAPVVARLTEPWRGVRARLSGPDPGVRTLRGDRGVLAALVHGILVGSVDTLEAEAPGSAPAQLTASVDEPSGCALVALHAPRIARLAGLLAELVTRHEARVLQALAGAWPEPLTLAAPCAEERARGIAVMPMDARWLGRFLRREGRAGFCRGRWWVGEATRGCLATAADWQRWRTEGSTQTTAP